MRMRIALTLIVVGLGVSFGIAQQAEPAPVAKAAQAPAPVDVVEFNRDIRPILSDNCFACHGPDENKRKAKLRLDREEGSRTDLGGYQPIVPGKADESELYLRVTHANVEKRMPPRKFGKQLTKQQTDLLRRWIEQGGKYQKHWSLIAAQRPPAPGRGDQPVAPTPRNPIDHFILAELDKQGLKPSPEADRRTLIRRLYFDLLGLPPAPEEVDAFVNDKSPEAYEKLINRLLLNPHYGERMAIYWLDLVRFADTGGYHSDNHRDVTPYRDWVIKAFNDNKRFDQFTIEQLAGDLLTNPTTEQKIGSGYNRLLQTTEEGGAQAKEYAAKYAADRVRNVSSVWLGATLGCAECHDHKFDPYTTKEFYRMASFFADIQEKAVGRQDQNKLPTPEQADALKQLDDQIATVQKTLGTQTPALDAGLAKWEAELKLPEVRKLPKNLQDIVVLDPAKRNDQQKQAIAAHYRTLAPELKADRDTLADLQKKKADFDKQVLSTLISVSGPPKAMRVLPRGNWLDDSGEVVEPGTPAALPPLGVKDRRATRLDLARWLTHRDNPMVARVFVNRLWKLMFGQGLVKSLEDFGMQGAWPSHPALLDWLAVEFIDSGWDVKHLIKLMAMSSTYRQTSVANEAHRQRDPYNIWLARQNRFRIDAEMVRDNALAISGLLSKKIGGASVKPYQPDGYWSFLNFPTRTYQADKGEDQYRRGLYTYWQRTFLHPSLLAFDAPSREECTVERPRSNTPLQALVLLNDPTYVESARVFAERIVRAAPDPEGRLHFAFRQALGRQANAEELKLLTDLVADHLKDYQADPKAAEALLKVGDRPAAKDLAAPELAAWTSAARVILNLHETITRN